MVFVFVFIFILSIFYLFKERLKKKRIIGSFIRALALENANAICKRNLAF